MEDSAKDFRSWIIVDLDNYRYNIKQFRKILSSETSIMQIVKADAYGHGSVEIAQTAQDLGIKWLGVANSDEGALLRLENITGKILILSPSLISEIDDILKYDLIPSVSRFQFTKELNEHARNSHKSVPIHLNFDTGMGRAGFPWEKASEVIKQIKELEYVQIEGIFSHFAQSEKQNDQFTTTQYERLLEIKKTLQELDVNPKYFHISNSAAAINYPQYNLDFVRLGLSSYGVYTDKSLKSKIRLKPVMKFCSRISLIKHIQKNYSISYNRTFVTRKSMKVALIPIGYADGYNYLLSNKGKVIINNQFCPILGKVTMDMFVVDITNLSEASVGDTVTLLGCSKEKSILAGELTASYEGLSYEMLCALGRRAKRIYVSERGEKKIEPISRRKFVANDFSDYKLEKIIHSSLNRRLNSNEIGSILYQELIKHLFTDDDKELIWKKDMNHSVKFFPSDSSSHQEFYKVKTKLNYKKKLTHSKFTIACATDPQNLEKYFLSKEIEYRWLLDPTIDLKNSFQVDNVKINNIVLDKRIIQNGNKENLEIECYHEKKLDNLIGKEVDFCIDTTTYYPKTKHQLTIYLSELTKGIFLELDYSRVDIDDVEIVSIFAGKEKYPTEIKKDDRIIIKSKMAEWFFPHSGVVFVW